MRVFKLGSLVALAIFGGAASATVISIPGGQRSSGYSNAEIEGAARQYARNLTALTRQERALKDRTKTKVKSNFYAFPVTIQSVGQPSISGPQPRGSGITLQFEPSGSQSFASTYKTFLESVFAAAAPTMDQIFGQPTNGGSVKVLNYDATLGDREVVGGGIYIHNNGGVREIRFPVYSSPEATAVNFIHTLLLAYQGSKPLPWDGWNEGLVRAAVLKIVRTPGALPSGLDSDSVASVLENTYDIGAYYDWNNQRALSGPKFVADNLRTTPLPVGGSIGGLYLLRYQMSGSAWQKVLTQYSSFASRFRQEWNALSTGQQTYANAIISAQAAVDALSGGSGLIEGLPASGWIRRQYILDPKISAGLKLQVQPVPILDGLGGSDFGVFNIQTHVFETAVNGNETLSRETSYPIYWTPDFARFFTAAQDERIDIFQGYGSVVPNFPGTAFSGQPYRMTIDVPVRDFNQRVMLPAGAIATASNPTPKNFFGTLSGITTGGSASFSVQLEYGSTIITVPVQNFAFGTLVNDSLYNSSIPVTIRVRRTVGANTTTVMTRVVSKAPGALGVQLDVDAKTTASLSVPKGVSMVGTAIEPWESDPTAESGVSLASRWNPLLGRFQFFPEAPLLRQGVGFFVRSDSAQSYTVAGIGQIDVPISVAVAPGWNIVSNPLNRTVALSEIQVVEKSNFPAPLSEAAGTILGVDLFRFVQGPNDPVSLAPETGSFSAANVLSPGQAVFVKCLAPTGATLVFGTPGNGNTRAITQQPRVWTYNAQLKQNGIILGEAKIGGRDGATSATEVRFDSDQAPGVSSSKLSVQGLYRDTRSFGPQQTYNLQLSGLTPGQFYQIAFTSETARTPALRVFDTTYPQGVAIPLGTYTFRPSGTTRTIQVRNSVIQ
jgi:hypothetical protein